MPAIIAWVLAGLSRLFASRAGQWVTSILVFLGLEMAVREVAVEPIIAQIQTVASGLAGDAVAWLAFFNLDRYITIVISAYAVASGKSVMLRRKAA